MVAGNPKAPELSHILGYIAVVAATINIVSGFLITDRMLKMFRKKDSGKGSNS
jgi:NAD(P) transhydrogenase subunit alpha